MQDYDRTPSKMVVQSEEGIDNFLAFGETEVLFKCTEDD